jgi:arginyl-tRNA--protein-N-Asp/Glu arginylyltransferase
MESLFRYVASPSRCGYLPDQQWSLEYDYVAELSPSEYLQFMLDGWRRFGHMLFRPVCANCQACRPLRIRAAEFRPDRSQRRNRRENEGTIELRIGPPAVTRAKLNLYDRYHAFQADHKGWPEHATKDITGYSDSFVHHPFEVEEWCYYLDGRLVGVGYVDALERIEDNPALQGQTGLSAIYFYYDPDERHRGLGTWNVLSIIEQAVRRGLPYVYLGYYVEGSPSMAYKLRFVPNEIRHPDGVWRPFRQ